jgi:hypothetical protein
LPAQQQSAVAASNSLRSRNRCCTTFHQLLPCVCFDMPCVCAAGSTDPALASLVYICNSSITTYDVTAGRAEPSSHSLPDSKLPQVREGIVNRSKAAVYMNKAHMCIIKHMCLIMASVAACLLLAAYTFSTVDWSECKVQVRHLHAAKAPLKASSGNYCTTVHTADRQQQTSLFYCAILCRFCRCQSMLGMQLPASCLDSGHPRQHRQSGQRRPGKIHKQSLLNMQPQQRLLPQAQTEVRLRLVLARRPQRKHACQAWGMY